MDQISSEAIQEVVDQIPPVEWNVDAWVGSNHVGARLDSADQHRLVRVIIEAAQRAWGDGADEGETAADPQVAAQRARRDLYESLKGEGLPIPEDLANDFAEPLAQFDCGHLTCAKIVALTDALLLPRDGDGLDKSRVYSMNPVFHAAITMLSTLLPPMVDGLMHEALDLEEEHRAHHQMETDDPHKHFRGP